MHLHLLIPDLLLPVEHTSPESGLTLPALETLLGKGRRTGIPALQTERWLLRRFATGRTNEDAADSDSGESGDESADDAGADAGDAAGAYSLAGDGGQPGKDCWLRADPVHLRVDRDALVLADASVFGVSAEEARALASTLNSHFGSALQIDARHPERWYARLPSIPRIRTTPIGEARGEPISGHLPSGEDAMHWHALMNEVQMALHQHEVNEAREARGELPVNSLWFWGNGVYAPLAHRPFNQVLSDDALARGLAIASGAIGASLPPDVGTWLIDAPADGLTLLVLDALRAPARYGDSDAWLAAAAGIEHDWIAPALDALRTGRIGMLTIHLPTALGGVSVETVRSDLRRLWRRRKPLAAYVSRPAK